MVKRRSHFIRNFAENKFARWRCEANILIVVSRSQAVKFRINIRGFFSSYSIYMTNGPLICSIHLEQNDMLNM